MGVPSLWYHQWRNAGRLSLHGCWCSRYLVPVQLFHALSICLATGDFTRSLVNDPPKTLWTRELKVNPFPGHFMPFGNDINLTFFFYLARRRLKFVQTVQARYSYLYWDWYRCRLIHLHTVTWLVSKLNQTEKIITDTCIGIWFG